MKERNNKHIQTCYEPVQESCKSLETIERKVSKKKEKKNNIHDFEYFVSCVSVQKAARSCSSWNKMSHLSDPWAWVMIWASISGYPSTFLGIHPLPAQQQPHKLCSSVWDGVFFFSFSSTALSFYMNGNTIFCSPSQKTWHSYSRPYCISRCCRRTTPAAEHWRASQKDDSSAFVLILNTHTGGLSSMYVRVWAHDASPRVCADAVDALSVARSNLGLFLSPLSATRYRQLADAYIDRKMNE